MYTPPAFKENDPQALRAVIRASGHDGPLEPVETILARIGGAADPEQGDQHWLL